MYFIVNRGAEEAYSCYSAVRLLFRDPRFQTICRISGKLPLSPPHFGAFFSTLYFLMRLRDRWACLAFVVLLFGLLPAIVAPQETPWQKENATWREEHKADLLKPHTCLSLSALQCPHSAHLPGFNGPRWFPPDPSYRVPAKWGPYLPQKTITLATLVGTSYDQPVPGVAEFTVMGKAFQLEPVLEDPAVAKLFFILRDTTSRSTTYGACRFLYTGFPSNGLDKPGEIVLDFNRLENPPSAYTPYSTSPLPPTCKRLPIALPVGEKRYH